MPERRSHAGGSRSAGSGQPSRRALVAQALGRVLGRHIVIHKCNLLAGGAGRRSYRVAAEGREYVVRLGDGLHGETLGLDAEADLMRTAAAAGLAPEVIGTDPASGTLVTRWLAGARAWTESAARRPRNMARIAALLRKLHALEAPLRRFDARHIARRYISEAHGRKPRTEAPRTETLRTESPQTGSPHSESLHAESLHAESLHAESPQAESPHPQSADLARELTTLAEEYDERFPPTAICHNDLVAENILDTGELRLIDFEYAVRAAPVLDLASLAAMNRMTGRQRRLLVEAYDPDGSASFSEDEFARVVRMSKLIAYFWARSQDGQIQATVSGHADRVKLLTEWP